MVTRYPKAANAQPAAAADPILHGQKLALQMLREIESVDDDGTGPADACDLEHAYNRKIPFRNIVLENLQRARKQGAAVEYGFTSALTHALAKITGGLQTIGARDLNRVIGRKLHARPKFRVEGQP